VSTLFLSAPGSSQVQGTVLTYDVRTIFARGIAPDYAIAANLMEQVTTGMKVIVFDRDSNAQMEGIVQEYEPTLKAENGIQRYNIKVGERRMVPYSNPPKVNHCGVAIW
jgi:hypothetical protein